METKYHLMYWLAAIALYFIGRFEGTITEMKVWFMAAKEKRPIIKEGEVFEVKCIGGE